MNLPSKLLRDAVDEFSRLPGIGKKTALRLVLHLLNQEKTEAQKLGEAIIRMRENVRFCQKCHNISDAALCAICENPGRKKETVCVVENLRDLLAIENTHQYFGTYHLLGGVISPIDGVGPEQLNIDSLVKRIREDDVRELIMALSPTIEGDTTIFYLSRQLKDMEVDITTIARGVSFGGELEYTDELTLARSIATRLPYEKYMTERND